MHLPLWKNANFLLFTSIFSSLKWLVFDLESHETLRFGLFCWKTKQDKISNFWPKTMHGLTPLEKCQIFVFFKWMFFEFKMASLLSRSSQNTLFGLFCWKTKKDKISNFWPTTMGKNKFYLSYLYLSFFSFVSNLHFLREGEAIWWVRHAGDWWLSARDP